MTDALGFRRKFGVIGPSTNTVVQPDFDAVRPLGVTNHYRGIFTPNADAVSNESFKAATDVIAGNVLDAVRSVMIRPGLSGDGRVGADLHQRGEGADAFRRQVEGVAGVKIST